MKKYVQPRVQLLLGQTNPILFWLWDGRSNKVLRVSQHSMWPTRSFHTAKSMKWAIASGEFVLAKDDE